MSNKEITTIIKLQIQAGKAAPSPPIGPALGQHGVNIMDFCKSYNDQTKNMDGVIPVEISVYKDKSFSFVLKTAPVSVLIKKALGIKSGSSNPNTKFVGTLTKNNLVDIVKIKMKDLNAASEEAAIRIIEGSARSMGVKIEK